MNELSRKFLQIFMTKVFKAFLISESCFGLRNHMRWVARQIKWVSVLRGLTFYARCVDYVGLNIFYVSHNFYMGCMPQKYFCVCYFFAWVNIFPRINFFVCGSKIQCKINLMNLCRIYELPFSKFSFKVGQVFSLGQVFI